MPDSKITALTSISTSTDPANDPLVIVDVSDTSMAATGTTKKVTTNQLLGSGGTATLASATITGDLTVDTNTLKVDSANNRVGVGTASPSSDLHIRRAGGGSTLEMLRLDNAGAGVNSAVQMTFWAAGTNYGNITGGFGGATPILEYNVGTTGYHGWQIAGSEQMRLNSTGLGVGVTPGSGKIAARAGTAATGNSLYADNIDGTYNPWIQIQHSSAGIKIFNSSSFGGSSNNLIFGNGTTSETMRIDSSGNVGIGVTPSAFSGVKALQIGTGALYSVSSGSQAGLLSNAFYDGAWKYISTSFAARYDQPNGSHQWFTAPSGTAGNAITFTQAMTLAANGQLLLGTSSTNGAVDIGMVMNKPSATGFVGNVYQLNGVDRAFGYIASAASAYTIETVSGYIIRAISATNGVYLPNGGTSWLALSDERFKDIIEPISNAVAKVGSLRSVIGKFKTESEGTRRSFLIAQDVQAVLPEAVDASNPDRLGVAYSEVIPLLVAAIKELTARVQTLETR